MIYADSLTHADVIAALEKGDFYASRGPIIKSIWYEDGVFHIECSPVVKIRISNNGRRAASESVRVAEMEKITSAEFPLGELDSFVRFTVEDEFGKTADTRAYFREEFESSPVAASNIRNSEREA
jgi:hypothetical protein